jgi:glutathione S-transferase
VYMRFKLFEPHRGLEQAGLLYAEWYVARLAKIAAHLATRDYLCAGRFTVTDIGIAYALYLSTQIGLGDRLPPRLADYLTAMTARPGFQAALAREAAAPQIDDLVPA